MHYYIVNPASRSGRGMKVWKQEKKTLLKSGQPFQVFFTKYPGHGRKLATEMIPDSSEHMLTVIGGDGTFNEVLNGLASHTSTSLSYLPVGSGNDLARGLGLSSGTLDMDTGKLTVHGHSSRFAISCGIGYDASICYEVSHTRVKKWLNRIHLGKLVYAYAAMKLLFSFHPCDMDVELDGKHRYHFSRVYFIAGMNLPCEGGGFRFCPQANCQDGLLDFIVVHGLSKLKILLLFPTAYFGWHTHFHGITILRGTSMKIHSSQPCTLHRDGEFGGVSDTAIFSAKKRSLRFRL